MNKQTNININHFSHSLQKGAMMVEFLVVASSVLISLFLLIPTLAKMMDIRHKTEQAGQYAIWEKTIWHRDGNKAGEYEVPSSIRSKTDSDIANEARQRILSEPNTLIRSSASATLPKIDSFHYFVDSKSGSAVYSTLLGKRGATASPLKIQSISSNKQAPGSNEKTLLTGEKAVDLYKVEETKAKFNTNGYFVNEASIVLKQPSWYSSFSDNITMKSQKAILADGWGAGGRKYNEKIVNSLQSNGFAEDGILGKKPKISIPVEFDIFGKKIKVTTLKIDLPGLGSGIGPSRKTFIKEWAKVYGYVPEVGSKIEDIAPDFVETDLLLTPDGYKDNSKNGAGKTIGHQLGTY